MSGDPAPAIRFGAAYYLEYEPTPALEHDLDLMRQAGFSVIRVGESVWSTWEPQDGVFDLEWLAPVLDAAHARGIGVVLGTPTYAIPMWLQRKYPEISGDGATGQRIGWGARQEMDFTHAAYRFHAERVIRRVVGRYRGHPAVIGYQVDNEPGLRLLFNEGIFQGFVDRLRRQYGTVDRLNQEWGLVYWSHRLSDWADLWRPDRNAQPQYDLAWRRYQADLVTDFIGWQADLVRDLVGPGPFITTCISYEQPAVEDADLAARLTIASGNAYYEMQDSLAHPNTSPRSTGPMGWVVRGPWAVTNLADLMYSSKQAPFLVTETNAGSIGFSSTNESPYHGQWRQAAWLLVARGARMVEYWHWNTNRFGAETYWGGVLPHSGIPGRVYREVARIGSEFAGAAGEAFRTASPDFDLAVLWDSDSKFALGTQAPFSAAGAFIDPDGYRAIVQPFARGIFDADRQARLVRPQQVLPSRGATASPAESAQRYRTLVAAALYTPSETDLEFLLGYAHAGGHLVLGPRTAVADREGRVRGERQPARLAEAAGVWYDELVTLPDPVPVDAVPIDAVPIDAVPIDAVPIDPVPAHLHPASSLSGCATQVAELLVTDGADVLARYRHPHLGDWAAATTRKVGAGRITVLGTVPDQALGRSLATWLAPQPVAAFTGDPSVTVHTSTTTDGRRLHVVHNWGWRPATATLATALTDLVSGEPIGSGDPVALTAWDVRVLASHLDPKEHNPDE